MNNRYSGEKHLLERIDSIVNDNLSIEEFGVSELARMLGMSRSNLHRRVHAATGESVSRLICRIRVEKAKEMLSDSKLSVSEVAYQCGFRSVSYFSTCFKEHYGYSPGRNFQVEARTKKFTFGLIRKKSSLTYLFLSAIFLIIIGALLITVRPFSVLSRIEDKSIAVLPFINDGPEDSGPDFIDGTMEAILFKLSTIKDLTVVSRFTVEQYRDQVKPIREIADELNVSYILTGSGVQYGNHIRIIIELIDAKRDRYIWTEEYSIEINEIENLLILQSDIAQEVASEIEATVTPFERLQIEQVPTKSNLAYEFFQMGRDAYMSFFRDPSNLAALHNAEDLFRYAILCDSTYIYPYVNLGWIYMNRRLRGEENTTAGLDSVQKYLKEIFKYGTQPVSAYNLLGNYYRERGRFDKSMESFQMSLSLNPQNTEAYMGMASLCWQNHDFVGAIENFHIALVHTKPDESARIYKNLCLTYLQSGCLKQVYRFSGQMLELTGDSAEYFAMVGAAEYLINHNITAALGLLQEGYKLDPGNVMILKNLGEIYVELGEVNNALRYLDRYALQLQRNGMADIHGTHVIGYAHLLAGDPEKANYYFDLQLEYCKRLLESNQNAFCQSGMISAWKG